MTFLIVALGCIIGMVTGSVILGELGPLFGFRNMEGSSAIFGVFVGAPLGLVCGGFFGYRMAKGFGEDAAKRKRFFLLTLGGIAALIAGGVIFETIRTSDYIDTQYQSAMWLNAQIRLPPGVAAPAKDKKIVMELRSDKETRKSSPYSEPDWKITNGRAQAYASVEVYRATDKRTLAVTIGGGPTYLFNLKVPARPKKYSYEGDWQKPDGVEGASSGAGEGMEIKVAM
jgi:MFS family permease